MSTLDWRTTVRSTNHERIMARSRYAVTAEPALSRAATRLENRLRHRLGLVAVAVIAGSAAFAGPARAGAALLGGVTTQSQVSSTAPANGDHNPSGVAGYFVDDKADSLNVLNR